MQKWNINFNRILKVASCSVVICTLLLASVVMPALAAADVQAIFLKDHIASSDVLDNGYVSIDYKFDDINPFLTVYEPGNVRFSGVYLYSDPFSIDARYSDIVNWHEWPLGKKVYANDVVDSGVLDISDFKSHSTLNVSLNTQVTFVYKYTWVASGDATVQLTCDYYIYFFDANGNPLSAERYNQSHLANLLEKYDNGINSTTEYFFDQNWNVVIPENAQYMAPCLQAKITLPGHDAGPQIHSLSVSTDSFTIQTSYNSILEDSETLKAINKNMEDVNNQLGDLNDKADTIINGSDEQWDQAQDSDEAMQDVENSLEDQLDQLDELEDFDTSTVFGTINEFLEADGWKDIRMLLAPLLDWTHAATLMLFVFAFSTLRILLLGR